MQEASRSKNRTFECKKVWKQSINFKHYKVIAHVRQANGYRGARLTAWELITQSFRSWLLRILSKTKTTQKEYVEAYVRTIEQAPRNWYFLCKKNMSSYPLLLPLSQMPFFRDNLMMEASMQCATSRLRDRIGPDSSPKKKRRRRRRNVINKLLEQAIYLDYQLLLAMVRKKWLIIRRF